MDKVEGRRYKEVVVPLREIEVWLRESFDVPSDLRVVAFSRAVANQDAVAFVGESSEYNQLKDYWMMENAALAPKEDKAK